MFLIVIILLKLDVPITKPSGTSFKVLKLCLGFKSTTSPLSSSLEYAAKVNLSSIKVGKSLRE